MALVSDYLTAQEFSDQTGEPVIPIARDVTRAIGALNTRFSWNLDPSTTYDDLSALRKEQVNGEAQVYANERVEIAIDAGIRTVARFVRRPLLDRLLTGRESIVVVPPSSMKGKICLEVKAFLRFASFSDDNVYPYVYFTKDDGKSPTGTIDSDGLFSVADVLFPDAMRLVSTASGTWPNDMDTERPAYFSVWVGVKTSDLDFPIYRQAVLTASSAFRGDAEGRPYPVTKTLRSMLGLSV